MIMVWFIFHNFKLLFDSYTSQQSFVKQGQKCTDVKTALYLALSPAFIWISLYRAIGDSALVTTLEMNITVTCNMLMNLSYCVPLSMV